MDFYLYKYIIRIGTKLIFFTIISNIGFMIVQHWSLRNKESCTDNIHRVALTYTVTITRWRINLLQWVFIGSTL